jgi:hypothetical protein
MNAEPMGRDAKCVSSRGPFRRGAMSSRLGKCTALVAAGVFLLSAASVYAAHTASVRDDGTILVDGKPFFPFGFYNFMAGDPQLKNDFANVDIPELVAAGFNVTVVCGSEGDPKVWNAVEASGLLSIPEVNKYSYFRDINACKKYESAIGYVNSDDFNMCIKVQKSMFQKVPWTEERMVLPLTPQEAGFAYQTGRKANPNHLNMNAGVGYPPYDPPGAAPNPELFDFNRFMGTGIEGHSVRPCFYRDTLDVWMDEDYPVYKTPNAPYINTYLDRVRLTAASVLGNMCFIGTPQTFSWGQNNRYPTAAEGRLMVYGDVLYGAKGILPYEYTYVNGLKRKPGSPELMAEYKTLVKEVLSLQGWFLNGTLATTSGEKTQVHAGIWTDTAQDKVLVIVMNSDPVNAKNISLPLPSYATGSVTQVFGRYPVSNLSISNGNLVGSLPAYGMNICYIGAPAMPPSACVAAPARGPQSVYSTKETTVAIEAKVTSGEVARIEFYADGKLIGEKATPPYTFNWTGLTDGFHALSVKAVGANGHSLMSLQRPIVRWRDKIVSYRFNEGEGATARDASKNAADGTIENSAWVAGRPDRIVYLDAMPMPDAGYGLSFNGTSTLVTTPNAACFGSITNEMSVAGWFKWNQLGTANCLMMRDRSFCLSKSSNDTISFSYYADGAWQPAVISTATMLTDAWTHVAVTVLDGTVRIYVNGTLDATHTGGAPAINNGGSVMTLGKTAVPEHAGEIFNGIMDNIYVFNIALTMPEVEFLSEKNSPVAAGMPAATGNHR